MDRDLVEAAQHGDQGAFMDLVRSRGGRLFAIAHRMLRDVDRAEDALQDALVIAWRDLPSLRDPDRFDPWIYRLLTNVCVSQATRERRRTANLRVLPLDGPSAPDDLIGVVTRDQLDQGFRRLTPEERAVLVLHHYVGYAPTEIAEMLGVPPGTIQIPTPPRPSRHARRTRCRGTYIEGRRPDGMTEHTDIDRLLESWFDDGPTVLPDRVVTVVADRIGRQSQRHAWTLERRPKVNLFLKVAIAAAIGIALLGGAVLLAGNRNTGPAPMPEPSPSPTAAASAAAGSPIVATSAGDALRARWIANDPGSDILGTGGGPIDLTISASGRRPRRRQPRRRRVVRELRSGCDARPSCTSRWIARRRSARPVPRAPMAGRCHPMARA